MNIATTLTILCLLVPSFAEEIEEPTAIASKKAVSFTTAGFGPANMRRFGEQKLAYNFYWGKFWALNEIIGLGFNSDFITDLESSSFISASLSSNYFPLKTNISPYAGCEIGLAFARGENENAFGFSMGTSAGVLFFRSSDVQLNLGLKAIMLLSKLPDGFPGCFQIRLGLLF